MRCFATLLAAVMLRADMTRVRHNLAESTREFKSKAESSEQLAEGIEASVPEKELETLSIPSSPLNQPTPMRLQRTVEAVTARGRTFAFLPSLEGKWSGERHQVLGGGSIVQMSSSTQIHFNHKSQHWEVRSSVAGPDCAAEVATLEFTPIDHGACSVAGAIFEESRGGLFATMSSYCPMGSLATYEVWSLSTVSSHDVLTRQVSRYSNEGTLESILVTTENRVEANDERHST